MENLSKGSVSGVMGRELREVPVHFGCKDTKVYTTCGSLEPSTVQKALDILALNMLKRDLNINK